MASRIYEDLLRRIEEASRRMREALTRNKPEPGACKTCGLVDCHPLCASKLDDNPRRDP